MFRILPSVGCTAALLAVACLATAQPRPDPLDPLAAVPRADHRSALAGYRRLGDTAPGAWREANDAVARIGGWRAYAREASRPEPAASAASAASAVAPHHH